MLVSIDHIVFEKEDRAAIRAAGGIGSLYRAWNERPYPASAAIAEQPPCMRADGDAHREQGKECDCSSCSPGHGTVAVSMTVIDPIGLAARLKFAIEMRSRRTRNITSCLIT
jgi:hypothetical protein